MEDTELFEVDTIILTEEDGSESEYAVLDKIEFEGKNYVILALVEGEEIGDEEFIFIYEEEDGDLLLTSIEDDEEFTRVSAYYDSLADEA